MTVPFAINPHVNLYVKGRITESDAHRQQATAAAILDRFADQPGVILADEVGMGKTFVALAVAASVALNGSTQPVVVMAPSGLIEKWRRDFELFRERCLPDDMARKLQCGSATRAVGFLKLLDDPPTRRKSVLFVTHGALSNRLADKWVMLALIRRAILCRRNPQLKNALYRVLGDLLQMKWVNHRAPGVWENLLRTPATHWLKVLQRYGIEPEDKDDPVPEAVVHALDALNFDELYHTLNAEVPRRESKYYHWHLKQARHSIKNAIRELWKECLRQLDLRLPLLVMDEAHHLKNSQTRLASLFHTPDAEQDADEISRGPLGGVFERMLFLTATPFQLGHHELCSVLRRFDGIAWSSSNRPCMTRADFADHVDKLHRTLDRAQQRVLHLDNCWGKLRAEDVASTGRDIDDIGAWWRQMRNAESIPDQPAVRNALQAFERARCRLKEAEALLQPWVIRHLKPRYLPIETKHIPRRRHLPGRAILTDCETDRQGIGVSGASLLPFLLAARITACMPDSRPVFAEGLASSFETFLYTRNRDNGETANIKSPLTDTDDDESNPSRIPATAAWYLDRLHEFLPLDNANEDLTHPKIAATVQRVLEAWKQGEKVTVFCHYVVTGRVLRQRVSQAIDREIRCLAAVKLACDEDEAVAHLERIGDRFFDTDSPVRRACDAEIDSMLKGFDKLAAHAQDLMLIVRRNLRTPSFLVRFFPIDRDDLGRDAIREALSTRDASGMELRSLLCNFFTFLEHRCGEDERRAYLSAMKAVQTGTHRGDDVLESYSDDEVQGASTQMLLPNVRLVNGDVRQETRQRLMLTFNTPFYPEILLASSVMAEGVDLHLSCRHVIHHDLCWNPSTLEQRTGRIDRIGAKVEQCGQPIHVYLPYIAATQDEKMYRVVMDRAQWFSIVMGEKMPVDARSAEQIAERVPVPAEMVKELAFRLEVVSAGCEPIVEVESSTKHAIDCDAEGDSLSQYSNQL